MRILRCSGVVGAAMIVALKNEPWWKHLGRLRYSSIEVTINGVVYEAVKAVNFEVAKKTVENSKGRLLHLKHEGADWIARPNPKRDLPKPDAASVAMLPVGGL